MSNSKPLTIAAIATPPGRGGVGIIRLSGPLVKRIAAGMLGKVPSPRLATLACFRDEEKQTLDKGVVLFFPAPNSFTGEDVLELQGHGGPVVMDALLARCLQLGATLAEPGEFSKRAFLNDKIDLVQAEAIASLIDSASRTAAQSAMRSLNGDFSKEINVLVTDLVKLRTYVEAALDFPDEDLDLIKTGNIQEKVELINEKLLNVLKIAKNGLILQEGIRVVLIGKPNAGKSSLLNRLVGHESAIVTDIPGTTRDVLSEKIMIDGIPLHVVDTAGLRNTQDRVELEGIKRTHKEMEKAHRLLVVIDSTEDTPLALDELLPEAYREVPMTLIYNKIDKKNQKASKCNNNNVFKIKLSAKTEEGIPLLREHLKRVAGFQEGVEGIYSARRRHLDALHLAKKALDMAKNLLEAEETPELVAEELLQAQKALEIITGRFNADDLLGEIFSSFCIGK